VPAWHLPITGSGGPAGPLHKHAGAGTTHGQLRHGNYGSVQQLASCHLLTAFRAAVPTPARPGLVVNHVPAVHAVATSGTTTRYRRSPETLHTGPHICWAPHRLELRPYTTTWLCVTDKVAHPVKTVQMSPGWRAVSWPRLTKCRAQQTRLANAPHTCVNICFDRMQQHQQVELINHNWKHATTAASPRLLYDHSWPDACLQHLCSFNSQHFQL
jgi:hypothetical protein